MLSGQQVLPIFDQALSQTQQQAAALDRKIGDLNTRLLELHNEESEAYRTLARIRLGTPEDDPLIQSLTAVDATVRRALEQRSSASADIDQSIAAITAEMERLRAERARAMAIAEERRALQLAAEDAALQQLETTAEYQQKQAALQHAEQIAIGAEQKLQQVEEDRIEKGKPYAADALFQYLWTRGHGTSRYSAGPFTRMMDRWVARVSGFEKARASYDMLQEIARRLGEHAQRLRTDVEAKQRELAASRQEAIEAGDGGPLRADHAAAEAAIEAIDDKIEAIGSKAGEAFARRIAITRGEDPILRNATDVIEGALRQQELRALRSQAQRTPAPEDDAAVRRLEALEAEEAQLLPSIDRAKAEQEAFRRQMAEIGSVRRDYRQRGHSRGTFEAASGALIGSLLSELLRGGMNRDVFWDQMGRQRRASPQSGGWGGGGGGWGGGGGGGQSSGGDFRTGGGF